MLWFGSRDPESRRDASLLAKLVNYVGSLIGIVIIVVLVAGVIGFFRKH